MSSGDVLPVIERLVASLEGLPTLTRGSADGASGDALPLRDAILLTLRTKIAPELRATGELPLFVGVQGGANTGKSTVFNSLAGHLLSPALVRASSTRHPLVFAHERWRSRLLAAGTLPGFDCRLLEDPRDLLAEGGSEELLFFRFHEDDSLRETAWIDSPDFDSDVTGNLAIARKVSALSDVAVFVTSAEKYRDRELLAHLRFLLELKAAVVVIFNRIDEEIVFRTLVDDLRSVLDPGRREFPVARLPRSRASHPEDELRAMLLPPVLEAVAGPADDVNAAKRALLERTLERTLERVRSLTALYSDESELKRRFERLVASGRADALAEYEARFDLALPEETLAVRRLLRETEIWPRLRLRPDVERSRRALRLLGTGIERLGDVFHGALLSVSRRAEGAIEDSPRAIAEYSDARNQCDRDRVQGIVANLRHELETFLRDVEPGSALARAVLEDFFGVDASRRFADDVARMHAEEARSRRGAAEDVAERVETWLSRKPSRPALVAVGSIAFKVALGLTAAWILPPDGLFSLLTWLEFAAGYLLGAYVIAVVVSRLLRRKSAFVRARVEGLAQVLDRAIDAPLSRLLERILPADALRSVARAVRDIDVALLRGSLGRRKGGRGGGPTPAGTPLGGAPPGRLARSRHDPRVPDGGSLH